MRRWFLAFLLFCAVPVTIAQPSAPNFGAWTQMWPWMWLDGQGLLLNDKIKAADKMKWQFAVANLEQYREAGYGWNLVVLRQGRDGIDGFRRARAIVETQRRLGIKTVFRLIEDPSIYLEPLSDLETKAGSLKKYADWVSSIAAKFSDDVVFYLISNEVDHDLGHNLLKYRRIIVDYPHYERLLETAREVLKKKNSNLQVVDHGVSAYSLGLAVADNIRESKGIFAAYTFWNNYNFGREDSLTGTIRLARMLAREGSQRRIAMVKATLKSNLADYHQLHWYFSPAVLPEVLDWIESQSVDAGRVRPLFVSELGYRMQRKQGKTWDGRPTNVADYALYSQRKHAASLIKNIAVLLSHGVRDIQYWQVRVHHERDTSAQLYMPTQDILRFTASEANSAYIRMIELLAQPLISSVCIEDTGLMSCRFEQENRTVLIMWSNSNPVLVNMPDSVMNMYSYDGTLLKTSSDDKLQVTEDPIIFLLDVSKMRNQTS